MNGFRSCRPKVTSSKSSAPAKIRATAGVPIISDEADIPEGDHVISYLFKLRYADPQELQQVLGQYLSPPQTYTSFLALPKSSSILVTENSSVIRTLVKIIDQVDIPPAEVVSEFIKLERADASKVVDMLKDIFEKGNQPAGGGANPNCPAGAGRAIRPVMPQQPQPAQVETDVGALIALSEESVVVGKIKIAADVRTNRIHVITRPINMPFVQQIGRGVRCECGLRKTGHTAFTLHFGERRLPVLMQSLTEPGENQQGAEGAGGAQGQQQNQQRRNTTNPPNQYNNTADSSSSAGSSLNISEELSTQPVDTAPKAVTVGNAKIIADQRANTIIVLGNREVVVKVAKILDEMDVSAPQVALSTVIGELTLNNDEQFGVDYFSRWKDHYVALSRNTIAPIPTGESTPTAGGTPTGPGIIDPGGLVNFANAIRQVATGTNLYIAAGNYLTTVVHLLESTGRFKVISRPMVFTSNNKKAIIASGQEIPVPVSTLSNAGTTGIGNNGVAAVESSIQFKKVALQLEVVPLINSEKEVSLDILQKIDSVVAGSSTNIGGNSVPTIATRYIRSTVSAPNGATIILGGLIQDNKGRSYNGIPILDRIPGIGALFRGTSKSHSRTELIVLMRPEVSLTKLDLYRLRQKNEDKTHFGPEMEEDDCPDCPSHGEGKAMVAPKDDKQVQLQLPPPDLPPGG